ncbi:MAG: hypothetical protein OEV66_04160 [Spirochaetia bacterium]|nr:hypothetical protein [Spirochaetia bacterium]
MNYKDDSEIDNEKNDPDSNKSAPPKTGGRLLYFDHERIRHMERMFDLFLTLFRRS